MLAMTMVTDETANDEQGIPSGIDPKYSVSITIFPYVFLDQMQSYISSIWRSVIPLVPLPL